MLRVGQGNERVRLIQGFTLVELMITLLVLAILINVAVPSMVQMLDNVRLSASEQNLVSAMRLARSESARTKQTMQLSAVNGDWRQGYAIVNTVTTQTFRVYPSMPTAQQVTANATTVSFYPDGSTTSNAPSMPVSIQVCDPAVKPVGRLVTLSSAGFVMQGPTSTGYYPCT